MGGTITMVTQEGTTITIPAHELAAQGAHAVTMVTTDGSDEQVGVAGTSLSGLFSWQERKHTKGSAILLNVTAGVVGSSGGTCEHGNRFLQGEAVNNISSCLLFLAAYNNVEEKDSNQTDQSKSLCSPALHACMRSDYMSHRFYNLMISVIMFIKKLPKNFFYFDKIYQWR